MDVLRAKFLLGSAAAFAGIATVRAPARAAQFSWKFGFPLAGDHSVNVRAVQAFAKIKHETNGDLDIVSYPNSSLGGTPEMLGQLRIGALETLVIGNAVLDTIVPMASIESIAFAFKDSAGAFGALDGDLGKLLRSQTPAAGIVLMEHPFDNGFRDFTTSNRPVRTLADVQGLKIRAAVGKLFTDFFRSLGISAVTVNSSDIYSALQTHLIDGQEAALSLIEAQRLFEVQKYCSITNHMWSAFSFMINRDRWQSLPPKYQEVLARNINAAALQQRRDSAAFNRSLADKLPRQGVVFNQADVSGFKAKLASSGYYARWRKEFGETVWTTLEKYAGPLG